MNKEVESINYKMSILSDYLKLDRDTIKKFILSYLGSTDWARLKGDDFDEYFNDCEWLLVESKEKKENYLYWYLAEQEVNYFIKNNIIFFLSANLSYKIDIINNFYWIKFLDKEVDNIYKVFSSYRYTEENRKEEIKTKLTKYLWYDVKENDLLFKLAYNFRDLRLEDFIIIKCFWEITPNTVIDYIYFSLHMFSKYHKFEGKGIDSFKDKSYKIIYDKWNSKVIYNDKEMQRFHNDFIEAMLIYWYPYSFINKSIDIFRDSLTQILKKKLPDVSKN